MRDERCVVVVQQWPLPFPPEVGVPVNGHHVGEVTRRRADAPAIPIEKAGVVASRVARQEAVPNMRVAVDDCEVVADDRAREQAGRRLHQFLHKFETLSRQAIAHSFGQAPELLGEALRLPVRVLGLEPCANGGAQPGIVPPCRMESCPRAHDALALRHRGRQRPLGGDHVRIPEVFEKDGQSLVSTRHSAPKQRGTSRAGMTEATWV